MNNNQLGFAIIGCGAISNFHAKAIKNIENANLVCVYDYSFPFAQKFANEYNCTAVESVEEILLRKDVDVVCICTPSGLHAKYAIQVANAKKHIVIEKPMAITKEQLDKVIAAVQQNNVKVAVITQLRFTPAIQKIKKAVEEGRLGKIFTADYRMKYYRSPEYYSSSNWRGTWAMDGGGALMNQAIHGIDLIQYIMGGIKSVYADCRTLARDIEVEDTANILVEYSNGAIGVIEATTISEPAYPRIIEITGTNGTIVLKEDVIERWDVKGEEGQIDTTETSSVGAGANPMSITETYHQLQIENLIDSIINNKIPLVDENEGRKPVDIILAAYMSNELNKKIII